LEAPSQKDTPLYFLCTGLSKETGTSVEKYLEIARLLHFGHIDMDFNWTSKARSIHADASAGPASDSPPLDPDPKSELQ